MFNIVAKDSYAGLTSYSTPVGAAKVWQKKLTFKKLALRLGNNKGTNKGEWDVLIGSVAYVLKLFITTPTFCFKLTVTDVWFN